MTRNEIYEKLNAVFSDVFDEDIRVTGETTAADIEDWDSLTHITLISEVEDAFDIKLSMKDVLGMQNVGEMVDIIQSLLS
jgi:acyl carrier protein